MYIHISISLSLYITGVCETNVPQNKVLTHTPNLPTNIIPTKIA